MSQVRVPKEMFVKRSLPGVCARSGVMAREQYLLAATGPDGPVIGAVPLSEHVAKTLGRLRRTAVVLFFISIAVIGIAVATRSSIFAMAASLLVVFAIVCLQLTSRSAIRATVEGDQVLLSGVHQTFVTAVTSPPKKCDGCTETSACSVADMHACEGAGS